MPIPPSRSSIAWPPAKSFRARKPRARTRTATSICEMINTGDVTVDAEANAVDAVAGATAQAVLFNPAVNQICEWRRNACARNQQ